MLQGRCRASHSAPVKRSGFSQPGLHDAANRRPALFQVCRAYEACFDPSTAQHALYSEPMALYPLPTRCAHTPAANLRKQGGCQAQDVIFFAAHPIGRNLLVSLFPPRIPFNKFPWSISVSPAPEQEKHGRSFREGVFREYGVHSTEYTVGDSSPPEKSPPPGHRVSRPLYFFTSSMS